VARSAGSWVGQAQRRAQDNVADYLRDESGHLLHQWEMDEFIHDVDDLRDRTERLLRKVQASDDQTP
jgi:ubiquinone biosynthesis protein UbiJ